MASDGRVGINVGIEDIEPDYWVAWVFDIPGCFSSGRTEADALAGVPLAYAIETNDQRPVTVQVLERVRAVAADDDPDFLVNAWFRDDGRPLTAREVREGIDRLDANRARLLDLLSEAPRDQEIERLVVHMATAEQWYLGQLNSTPERPAGIVDPLERLQWVRSELEAALLRLVGRQLEVTQLETWTPRKLLRRAIWHERDHTMQIEQYVKRF